MRIINKKYLLIIILVGVLLTGVIAEKPNKKVKLDNVILKQEVNNKTFAMYKEDDDNNYVKVEGNKFPDMYVLNLTESKCIDNNGNELEGVLSYENDKVTITSGNTTYCYLYFDKSLGLEIKEKNPNKLSTEIKGAMYRFQGQQSDGVNNYICFGTSDKEKCTSAPDKYMYRIIGIEATTGRVKVIKKEALEQTYQWWEDYDTDKTFPESNIYEGIKGNGFLANTEYVPTDWEEKISNNTWMYGDLKAHDTLGANQTGEELYKVETGQKGTIWDEKANQGEEGAYSAVVENENSQYNGETFYYKKYENKKWTKTFESKVSLMYLHDYYYSVSDTANCEHYEGKYTDCRTGWMHLSNNDEKVSNGAEWTMTRFGWSRGDGFFEGHVVNDIGSTSNWGLREYISVRPVFYISASENLLSGTGTMDDPFIIKS